MSEEPTVSEETSPPERVLYALYGVFFVILLAVLIIVSVYAT